MVSKIFKIKKSQVEYLLENAFRIGFLMIALLAFFLLINYYINNKMDTQYLESQVVLNRVLYSDSIMVQDADTGKIYTGIVDIDKLDNDRLDINVNYGRFKRHVAVKLKLLNKDPDPNNQFIKDAYINKPMFDNWKKLIDAGISGKGGAMIYITQYPVTYLNYDQKYYYGTLVVEIIVPNS